MMFYERVINDHLNDIIAACKSGKLTNEKAIDKLRKISQYIYYNERYRQQKKQVDCTNNQDYKS